MNPLSIASDGYNSGVLSISVNGYLSNVIAEKVRRGSGDDRKKFEPGYRQYAIKELKKEIPTVTLGEVTVVRSRFRQYLIALLMTE